MDDTLLFRSVAELQPLLNSGELSACELVDTMLSEIERLQPVINAFITVCSDEARIEAEEADQAHARGERLGPLHGVPFMVKDLTFTAGVRTTMGSATHQDFVPTQDAVPVERLKRAGAILLGKTTTPEFGHKPMTDSPIFGVTRNPWDLTRSPAGSSGGSAAAIAAGLGPLALGTDGGGSIRIPASVCGIVGLKATLGRIPNGQASDTFNNLSHIGPMTRTVDDARRMLDIVAGPHVLDVFATRQTEPSSTGPLDLKGLTVAWLPTVGNSAVESDVLEACEASVRLLEGMGAEVRTEVVDFVSLEPVFLTIMRASLFSRLGGYLESHGARLSDSLKATIELGANLTVAQVQRAQEERTRAFRYVQALFDDYDVLASPVLAAPALPLSQQVFDSITIDGKTFPSLRAAWNPYTYVFNLTGHPAMSIPSGWTTSGLPIGLQLAGPWYAERRLLDIASRLEEAAPWHARRPDARNERAGLNRE